ncbi:zeaxanthin epoxidase [Pyrus ussuriensis x Pyrus communis]|uniref:Zeaxanthin epoxidase n=1 Tax=Pyrus ussuriensis x Pyrus communis TaxID=2448454 RepID=A0A5N5FSF1_9ROSA|nr:zeaxanthin epoxidase [Pyrus ussuriensis x Pyrus communis]
MSITFQQFHSFTWLLLLIGSNIKASYWLLAFLPTSSYILPRERERRSMMARVEDVVIVGAGIAGLATAKSDGLRTTGAALTLFPNAWCALDALGVSHHLTSLYATIKKGYVTNIDTGEIKQISFPASNGNDLVGPRSVHRKALLKALADELPPNAIRFASKLTAIETQEHEGSSISVIHLGDGTIIKAKVLIGCDGIHSVVARLLGLAEPVYAGRSGVRGLAVFPQGHGLDNNVQQYGGLNRRAGFVPLNDKEIYWFFIICLAKGADPSNDPEVIKREVIEKYAKDLPPIYLDVVRHSDLSTLSWAPLMFRYPWHVVFGNLGKQNITVAGDAMHPMTPDLGQGGCVALEDAVVLGRYIGTSFVQNGQIVPKEMVSAIGKYVEERRWRVALLIAGSYLSGWIQQPGSGGVMKFLRDTVFYGFIFHKLVKLSHYDCGKLDF